MIKNRVFSVRFFLSRGKSERARLAKLKSSGRVNIGRFSYGDPHIEVFQGDNSRVSIGSFCSIASEVTILVSGNHRSDWVSTFPFGIVLGMPGAFRDGHPASKGDVIIGSDVWIGRGATILSGSTIGHGAVVGAEAVVAGNVRPYSIVVGNPAREIRRRFSDEIVDALLILRWWDWPIERIKAFVPLMCSSDVEHFLAAAAHSEQRTDLNP